MTVTDITAGKLTFSPAANGNGQPYTSFTFQVQDDGGTDNGGVDLDPTAEYADGQRNRASTSAGGNGQDGHNAGGHAVHVRGGGLRLHRSQRQAGRTTS